MPDDQAKLPEAAPEISDRELIAQMTNYLADAMQCAHQRKHKEGLRLMITWAHLAQILMQRQANWVPVNGMSVIEDAPDHA